MIRIEELLNEIDQNKKREAKLSRLSLALEHHTYKNIPGTRNSIRVDPKNTNTVTQRHAHVYAKPNGMGKQIYSVNLDGSGHDGSSGIVIPAKHAEYLRGMGFEIPMNLALESIDLDILRPELYEICILENDY